MSFNEKLKEEYEAKGLFSFLAKQSLGETNDTHRLVVEGPKLVSFEYVLKHPDSDLERIYVAELVNLLVQEELKRIMPKLKEIAIPVIDSEDNIVFTRKKNKYEKSKIFYCFIDEDLCIPRNKIAVKEYLPSIVLTQDNKLTSTTEINIKI
ncbi:hypothetical protein KO361_04690 [Candidatus Woesearchaeota archaeon]|nr:hypothetical protein [Candidatus Woesearchaeota archaeon]